MRPRMTDTVTVIDYNEPIADNGACYGDFLEAEVERLRKALDEARAAKAPDADTVTVPREALDYVLTFAVINGFDETSCACKALQRALDTKTEMPDEPGHPVLVVKTGIKRRPLDPIEDAEA